MSGEKYLNEADWKKFAKGRDYKDAALLKAFAALDKAEKAGPAQQLEALDEIDKQGQVLLKAAKGDKELAAYLDELDKAIRKQRKTVEKAAASEADEDEEEETPALLTSKMIPLLRQVPKGEVLQVMIAMAGKDTAVLVSRKPIGPPRRKLLTNYLGSTAGVKFFTGECLFEAKAHTFVLNTAAAGLAKKLKAALLAQTEIRYKVRVRGLDPGDVDEDGDEGEQEEQEQSGDEAEDPAKAAYGERLALLQVRIDQALKAQHPDATRLGAVATFAEEKAGKQDFAAALKALDMLEKLLGAAVPAPPAQAGRFVHHAKARLAWLATRQRVAADLKKLEEAILLHYRDEPEGNDLAQRLRKFDTLLLALDSSLIDTLDAALNAADMAQRAALHEQAQGILRRYAEFVRSEPLLPALDENPFLALNTHQTLLKTLQVLEGSLS